MGKKRRGDRIAAAATAASRVIKTREERAREVVEIITKLQELGLSTQHESVAEFYRLLHNYQSSGCAQSGSIPLLGLQRTLHYILTTRRHVTCSVTLRYAPGK